MREGREFEGVAVLFCFRKYLLTSASFFSHVIANRFSSCTVCRINVFTWEIEHKLIHQPPYWFTHFPHPPNFDDGAADRCLYERCDAPKRTVTENALPSVGIFRQTSLSSCMLGIGCEYFG